MFNSHIVTIAKTARSCSDTFQSGLLYHEGSKILRLFKFVYRPNTNVEVSVKTTLE